MIVGYRDFTLHYSYKGFRLRSRSNAYVWNVGVNEAQCSTSSESARDHLANGLCSCGFYAFNDISRLDKLAPIHSTVLMWGKVVEHEFGYRTEFAEVEALLLPETAACQAASHSVTLANLHVLVDARPIDPFTACSACIKQLAKHAGAYEAWWQSLTYDQVLAQLAQTYGVPLVRYKRQD